MPSQRLEYARGGRRDLKDRDMFDLENYIPYLVRRIVPRLDDAFGKNLKALDISVENWRILITLYDRGPLSLSKLAELTSINLSTLSRMIDRMAERKLIRRNMRNEGSRRWAEIELLTLGTRKCELLLPPCNQLQEDIVCKFSSDELEQIKKMLRKLYNAVEAIADAPPNDLSDASLPSKRPLRG
jgi:MarR family transcriptional regulator, organic hydroperoxide resistance regulator